MHLRFASASCRRASFGCGLAKLRHQRRVFVCRETAVCLTEALLEDCRCSHFAIPRDRYFSRGQTHPRSVPAYGCSGVWTMHTCAWEPSAGHEPIDERHGRSTWIEGSDRKNL